METVEEHPVLNTSVDIVKPNLVEETSVDESNVCHKSNGVDCDVQAEGECSEADSVPAEVDVSLPEADHEPPKPVLESEQPEVESKPDESDSVKAEAAPEAEPEIPMDQVGTAIDEPDSKVDIEVQPKNEISHADEISHDVITETAVESEKEICIEEEVITETMVEMDSSISNVQFETEILVEENDYDVTDNLLVGSQESDQTNNILNELEPNIELSEVLRSSDTNENVENNNSTVKQEIFNKEELLDILEGNDNAEQLVSKTIETSSPTPNKVLAAEIALQQLSRLKRKKNENKLTKVKKGDKAKSPIKGSNNRNSEKGKQQQALLDETKQDTKVDHSHQDDQSENPEQQSQGDDSELEMAGNDAQQPNNNNDQQQTLKTDQQETHSDSIVKSLVMDWEDEPSENNEVNEVIKEGEKLIKDTEDLKNNQECIISKDEKIESISTDSPSSETQTKLSKADDDAPTRRLSRVIKKKVIFDPDNPDTFTKGKSSKAKETLIPKEQTPTKKGKTDPTIQRSKSKSPLSKLQWKKPTSGSTKNSKQHKRLTEVDRLLMDEGAVNMIYQLTPEAPKGKKNVRTKAEFIKKIQSSSTPDTKEMKFRERKKDSKYEEGEAKKILGGKHRTSLSSSVKSPAISEDFETHSADDSIIYRRHSSSSYSSSCMSPRRLSDVEAGSSQSAARQSQQATELEPHPKLLVTEESVFNTEPPKISSSDMINKNDCLSIKEKLNSKLSLALNKRKRENSKIEKPAKQKKILKTDENITPSVEEDNMLYQFNFISVAVEQRLALICIKKTGLKVCVEILKELEEALKYIDSRQDISITLLESQCGTLCSSLDLSLLLDENKEIRANHAYELAESVRSLLSSAARHRKLLCCGVWGACAGVALALVALSDVALASEGASFWLAAAAAPALPGAAALAARCRPLPQALVNDLVIFGRRLSAGEALQGGLVSRVLWPDRFDEQVRNIASDIAAQPLQSILLKKKLLSLKSNSEAELTFLACLETERDLLVEYWTSVEGQELLRATLDAA